MLRSLGPLIVVAAVVLVLHALRKQRSSARPQSGLTIGSLEADQQTLHALRDAGANLTKPTEVNFYLYFPTRAAADSGAEQAATPELRASVERGANDASWLCLLSGQMIPTETRIHAGSTRLEAVAAAHGGEYYGWGAAVEP